MTKETEYSTSGTVACAVARPSAYSCPTEVESLKTTCTYPCPAEEDAEAFCGGRVLRNRENNSPLRVEGNGEACGAAGATLRCGDCVLVREEVRLAEDGTALQYRLFREFGDTRGAFSTPCESFYTLLVCAERPDGGREACRLPDIAREGGAALGLLMALADGTVFPSTAREIVEDLLAAHA